MNEVTHYMIDTSEARWPNTDRKQGTPMSHELSQRDLTRRLARLLSDENFGMDFNDVFADLEAMLTKWKKARKAQLEQNQSNVAYGATSAPTRPNADVSINSTDHSTRAHTMAMEAMRANPNLLYQDAVINASRELKRIGR